MGDLIDDDDLFGPRNENYQRTTAQSPFAIPELPAFFFPRSQNATFGGRTQRSFPVRQDVAIAEADALAQDLLRAQRIAGELAPAGVEGAERPPDDLEPPRHLKASSARNRRGREHIRKEQQHGAADAPYCAEIATRHANIIEALCPSTGLPVMSRTAKHGDKMPGGAATLLGDSVGVLPLGKDMKHLTSRNVEVGQPREIACFTRSADGTVHYDNRGLRLYKGFPRHPVDLKEGFETFVPKAFGTGVGEVAPLEHVLGALDSRRIPHKDFHFVILLTPYNRRKGWEMGVVRRGETVFLDVRRTREEWQRDEASKGDPRSYFGYKFEQVCTMSREEAASLAAAARARPQDKAGQGASLSQENPTTQEGHPVDSDRVNPTAKDPAHPSDVAAHPGHAPGQSEGDAAQPGKGPVNPSSDPVNPNNEFCAVFRCSFGSHVLCVAAEMDCVRELRRRPPPSKPGEAPPGPNGSASAKEIIKREYVELKTTLNFSTTKEEDKRQRQKFEQEKMLEYWVQAYLVNVPIVVCGMRDEGGRLLHTQEFPTDFFKTFAKEQMLWESALVRKFGDWILCWLYAQTMQSDKNKFVLRYNPQREALELYATQLEPKCLAALQSELP
eukprot:jgi/Mesvir1/15372/Mv06568-RA.2